MAGVEEDDTHFGPTPPSLLDFLKKVLREYTDGQIMKEIVQNAEDAGAKTVRFLYDTREHGTNHLYWPSLAPYQGRALYAYNDALFKASDWGGIQKPARSNKEDNPLKVGRFGIGFSSVYHLTDLPSILSGETLAIIDPQERHFGRGQTGTKLNIIKHAGIFNSPEFVDQFTPYNNLFPDMNYVIGCGEPFDGTVFRFPIRQEGSTLCANVYDDAAMVRLLESFVDDADVVLLFLRSLQAIDISRREDQTHTKIRTRVEVCPESLALIEPEREGFSRALKESSKMSFSQRTRNCLTYQFSLNIEVAGNMRRTDWIVSQVVGGREMPDNIMSIAQQNGYIPWVGVAMPYNLSLQRRDGFSGRVFCFLPLPPGDESLTGFPVHIHGFFGVNSDRRSIKWPGADRVQGDVDARWNFLLVTKLLPDAYINVLRFAIENQRLHPDDVYRAWPDPCSVLPQWQRLIKPILQLINKHRVIYATKGDDTSSWVKVKDAVFNFLSDVDENTERILLTILKAAKVPVAKVPKHIQKIIQSNHYVNFNAKEITPEVIINCIHKSQHAVLETLGSEDKLVLLEYIISRTKTSRLIGLRLLPLANGDFVPFSTRSPSKPSVFIPIKELDRNVCYNMDNRLISPNISHVLRTHLEKVADNGSVQLEKMTDKSLVWLIRDTLPKEWFSKGHECTVLWHPGKGNHPPPEWLKGLWDLLNISSRKSIEKYVGLPLIKVEERQSGEVLLAFLKRNSTCISQSYGSDKLDSHEKAVLTKIGVVICSCPTFIDTARLIGDGYLRSPSKRGVIAAMTMIPNMKLLQKRIRGISNMERQTLVRFYISCSITDVERNFIRQLPLFETISRSPSCQAKVVSASDTNVALCRISLDQLPKHHLPEYDLICSNDDAYLKLLSDVGVNEKHREELLKDIVNAFCRDDIDKSVLQEVGIWILHDWKSVKRTIGSHLFQLKSRAFILSSSGQLRSPGSIFDPEDGYVSALFSKDYFPSTEYTEEGLLEPLREIGLRNQTHVTANEISWLVVEISRDRNIRKAVALISFLGEYSDKLNETLTEDGYLKLQQFLADKHFIPCLMMSPEFYPEGMPWNKPERKLISPKETVISTEVNILASGATIPFAMKSVPISLQRSLGVRERPHTKDIIEQMSIASKHHSTLRTPVASRRMNKMVHALYCLLSTAGKKEDVPQKLKSSLPACIWTGRGFSQIQQSIMSRRANDFQSYLNIIPQEYITEYEQFFLSLGVKTEISAPQVQNIIRQIQRSEPISGSVEERKQFCRENKCLVLKALIHLDKICEGDLMRVSRNVLVPSNNEHHLELVFPKSCVFQDIDGREDSDYVQNKLKEDNTFVVDGMLPIGIVRALGISPLSRKLLAAVDLPGIEQAGQYEPLTTRLKNIIKDSYLETSIPKEMIQNAEDAKATKVHFMLDLRENYEARSSLFDKGMNDCQGPALWVYNDACFTPDDFKNIAKLGGATKESDISKIGRFGLGFNSVYHLTDVPSFLSGEHLQVFDPHTTHLNGMLKSKESPGIRINLDDHLISMFKDQFAPYEGVFNCSLQSKSGNEFYDATLFRLPLRSRRAALTSEISDEHYDEHKCKSLLNDLWLSSEDLLVFTKNVHEVTAFVLLYNAKHPSEARQLFKIEKESEGDRNIMTELQQCRDDVIKLKEIQPLIKQECVARTITPFGKEYLQVQEEPPNHELMSVTCIGKTLAHKMWRTPQGQKSGLAPVGGVAMKLPLSGKEDGKLYNGLPLSVPQCHLPCHCNGFFAISADRRNLWKPSSDSKANYYTQWNEAVFKDIVSKAYMTLMTNGHFQSLVEKMPSDVRISGVNSSPENFYRLWPSDSNITQGSDGFAMLIGFFKEMMTSESEIFWEGDRKWSFKEAIFIDPILQGIPHVYAAVKKILQMQHNEQVVTEMPLMVRGTLERLGFLTQLNIQTCSYHAFFRKHFLPQISTLSSDIRDPLIHYCLSKVDLQGTLKTVACIPTTPDGNTLKRPADLIHPTGKASNLFADEDERFPYGSFAERGCLHILGYLGMVCDDISGTDFIQCAWRLSRKPIDHVRDRSLIEYLIYRLRAEQSSWAHDNFFRSQLKRIAFLPVIYKNSSTKKAACNTIFTFDRLSVVSEVAAVLDESQIRFPYHVKRFLGIVPDPPVNVVLQQLEYISGQKGNIDSLSHICQDIYRLLDSRLQHGDSIGLIQKFFHSPTTKKSLFVGKVFMSVDQLALYFDEECIGSHLFRVPDYLRCFKHLLSYIQVKTTFSTQDFLFLLNAIHDSTSGTLKPSEFELVMKLLKCLVKATSTDPMAMKDMSPGVIYVPDSNGYLRTADELSFCDVEWISLPDDVIKTHEDIPITWARKLGIRDIRQHILKSYSTHVPGLDTLQTDHFRQFGQREHLTDRIQNILKGYPCDDTILKELVQNADDSCATEVHLVLDLRKHPTDRLFRDDMSHLQGPALCVYNNKAFTDADIEGIQRLGVGSKRDMASKVGRFGVGFNAVYHLTDCPSFYTDGDTLGMLDPNVMYVPNATIEYPGFMVKGTGKLKESFPNVFNCYLPEFFEGQGSTIFRLPLRTESMAKVSRISSMAHDAKSVKSLMEKFKEGLPELLLFLNNVKKVSLSTIDEKGFRKDTSSAQSCISKEKQADLNAFVTAIPNERNDPLTGCPESLRDISVTDVHYEMKVTVTEQQGTHERKYSEDWLIYQQHGFGDMTEVPESMLDAYDSGNLRVLPLGGVAVPLSKQTFSSKAYSFLPLPIPTGLPVHVNGSIELDERRRDIWRGKNDVRAQWNRQIMRKIVSQLYLKALLYLQVKICGQVDAAQNETEIHDAVLSYTAVFPVTAENSFWKELITDIYRTIANSTMPMFPSIRRSVSHIQDGDETMRITQTSTLEWKTPLSGSQTQGFFDSPIQTDQRLRSIVCDIGFPLIECSQTVQDLFANSVQDHRKGNILEITPASLMSHLSSNAVQDIGLSPTQLPRRLSETVLKDIATLKVVLKYCCQSDDFRHKVVNLPLLATSDGLLRKFSADNPVYNSKYDYLFPSSRDQFLDRSLGEYFKENFDVINELKAPYLATLLRKELCPAKFECNKYVQWDKSEPTVKWITGIWDFLAECGDGDDFKCISSWSILPCLINGNIGVTYQLVPLSKATSVMNRLCGISHLHIALSSLGVSEVDWSLDLQKANQLITKMVAQEQQPDAVLAVFDHIIRTDVDLFDQLATAQRDHILKYFAAHMPETLVKSDINKRIMMSLPCYKQLDGTYVSIKSTLSAYVIRARLPREENTVWMSKYRGSIFLPEDISLENLYRALGFVFVSECDTLSNFIFPKFNLLSTKVRLQHLEYVKSLLSYASEENGKEMQKRLRLLDFALLEGNDGVLRAGREFFDHRNRVFAEMLPERHFPSKEVIETLGEPFLLRFGIQSKITTTMFLGFAEELSNNVRTARKERTKLAEQSKTLVKELFWNCTLHENKSFLNSVKSIDFIIPEPPELHLTKLHPYYGDVNMGIRLESSCLETNANLVWCSMRLLPEYISHISTGWHCTHERDYILDQLGVVRQPITESVMENVRKMCCRVHVQGRDTDKPQLTKVMEATYKYFLDSACENPKGQRCSDLTDRCNSCQMMTKKLSDVPCVVIQSVPPLVRPTLVCRTLDGDLFQPHLYQLPDNLIPFDKLLYCLGCTRTPSFSQMATVLNGMARQSVTEMKNPNMLKAVRTAAQLFLQLIETLSSGTMLHRGTLQADLQTIQVVHLPSSSKGKLLPSTDIFIKDETDQTKRLVNSNVPFLPDAVTKPFSDLPALVDFMPQHIKLRSLKTCVTEMIDESARLCLHEQVGQCNFGTRLKGLIHSKEFSEAIRRLLEVERGVESETVLQRLGKLKMIQLLCMAELPTSLFIDGKRIEGSEAKVTSCVTYDDSGALCIRVPHTSDNERSAYMDVVKGIARAILQYVGGISQDHMPFLADMLSADSARKIPQILRSYKLITTKGQAAEHEERMAPPTLGSKIPNDIIHLLEQDPYVGYTKGEYVVYQIENDDLTVNAILIHVYAQVLDVPENLHSPLRNKYLVDIGQEAPELVSGLTLFKFLMPEEESQETSMAVMVYCGVSAERGAESPPTSEAPSSTEDSSTKESQPKRQPYPENLEEAKKQVTEQLEEIWGLEESDRKKAIRRIYLRWHPDKHPPERKHLATEAFKHLLNEIERLKAGIKRDNRSKDWKGQGSSNSKRRDGDFFDEDFFDFMGNWARQDGRRRESYQRNYRERGHTGNARSRHCPPSFDDTPEPDMPKASCWFKQAESDLSSSCNDLEKGTNEWVCFKCHHAAEKALKAAQFASRGTANSSHNLEVLVTDLKGHFSNQTVTECSRQLSGLVDVDSCLYPKTSIFQRTIPCESFSRSDAERARKCASDTLKVIKEQFKL